MEGTDVRRKQALIEAAAQAFGEGSWQHLVRSAYLTGLCAQCGGELEEEGHCPTCRLSWSPQFRDEHGLPKPASLIVRFADM